MGGGGKLFHAHMSFVSIMRYLLKTLNPHNLNNLLSYNNSFKMLVGV